MNEMKADPGDAAAAGDRQNALIAALCDSARYPHDVGRVRVLETHISWVLLTGRYAYKIKKAVDFGFLDFSTLARRKHCCEEELRLNRRLAPDIYLDVVPIRGSHQAPRFDGDGPVVEYAVRMREFPQGALADALLPRGDFGAREIDLLAVAIARFHGAAAQAGPATGFGAPELVLREALQNFDQISEFGNTPDDQETLENLRAWTMRMHGRLRETMALRLQAGYVRECHGDLHLGNIAVLDGQPVPFDCIEFNPELRWIDVMSELAFLTMDLADRGYPQLAARILNRYLEEGGDYDGVRLFDFFQVYRALVRAKVQRLHQGSREAAAGAVDATEWGRYIALSRQLAAPRATFLLITHGLSGCGKSTVSQSLLEGLCAVRVRSDVERKRLYNLPPLSSSESAVGGGIYTSAATAATYGRLESLAEGVIRAGYPAIVDAAFLMRAERVRFRELAARLRVPFVIADVTAPEAVLRDRVAARQARGKDASEAGIAVLERQIAIRESLFGDEAPAVIAFDGTRHAPETWREAVLERIS